MQKFVEFPSNSPFAVSAGYFKEHILRLWVHGDRLKRARLSTNFYRFSPVKLSNPAKGNEYVLSQGTEGKDQ